MSGKKSKNPKTRKEYRMASLRGDWPVADPEPYIIDLLRRISYWDNPSVMTPEQKSQASKEVQSILDAWRAREDTNELKKMLGVGKRGRRRNQRTVNSEYDIAFAYYELRERLESKERAAALVAEIAHKSVDHIELCADKWANVEKLIKRIHEGRPNMQIDYHSAFDRSKREK